MISEFQPCHDCPPKQPFCTTCGSQCDEKFDAACTIYHLNAPNAINHLTCLGLPNGISVEAFMEAVDTAICEGITVTPVIHILDTTSIDLSGDGTTGTPLSGVVKISPDANNIISIHSNGLYATADLPTLCADVEATFTDDVDQYNGQDVTTYDFLVSGDDCVKVSPPTGFAVAGDSRVSAFGKMEWFDTLTLANTAASSGETVLLYSNTSENLTTKNGVNYCGIGTVSIAAFTSSNSDVTTISLINITITGALTVSNNASILTTNVKVFGDSQFTGSSSWSGGHFYDNSTNLSITDTSRIRNIYSEKRISISAMASLNNFDVFYTGASSEGVAVIVGSGFGTVSVSNGKIKVTHSGSLALNSYNDSSTVILENIVAESTNGPAVYIQCGIEVTDPRTTTIARNITGYGATIGISIISSRVNGDSTETTTNFIVDSVTGYGKTTAGIFLIDGTVSNSFGYSETGDGIVIGGSDNPGRNININNCTGESKGAHGLNAQRDVFVNGGTYISRLNTSAGNPILFGNSVPRTGMFIAGVKTIAVNTSAYAIKAATALTARISGCSFLNPNLTSAVPGIDPTITLNTVVIDSSGNMK